MKLAFLLAYAICTAALAVVARKSAPQPIPRCYVDTDCPCGATCVGVTTTTDECGRDAPDAPGACVLSP